MTTDSGWRQRLAQLAETNDAAALLDAIHAVEVRCARWARSDEAGTHVAADEWRLLLGGGPGEVWAIQGLLGPDGRPLGWSACLRRWEAGNGWTTAPGPRQGATWAGRLLEEAWRRVARRVKAAKGGPGAAKDAQAGNGGTRPRSRVVRRPEWTVANGTGGPERVRATEARIRRGRTEEALRVAADGSLWEPGTGGSRNGHGSAA